MPKELEDIKDTQVDIDTSEALDDISSELFGQDSDGEAVAGEEEVSLEGAEAEVAPASPAIEPESPPQSSEEVQALGAPETWTKEAIAEWATVPPRVQQEILKREQDMHRGIEQYRGAAEIGQKYDSVVEPYRALLAAENVDPVQLFQSFAGNHYLLSRGTPEQKAQIGANLIRSYGIDIRQLAAHLDNQPQIDPQVAALQKEIAELRAGFSQVQKSTQEASIAEVTKEVNAFATDPNHPYFDELIDDIEKFLKSGASLQEAYDSAVYANPVTRQKEIDRLTAEKFAASSAAGQARETKIAKSRAAEVVTTPRARNGTVPVGTLDDTLEETMASIANRA